jgi:hypothetical protein
MSTEAIVFVTLIICSYGFMAFALYMSYKAGKNPSQEDDEDDYDDFLRWDSSHGPKY